jgi:hypothetical protein
MFRLLVAVLGALVLAPTLAADAQSAAAQPNPAQESGSPINDQGSSYDYRSYITGIAPNVPGLSLQVLEFADRLVLTNHTGTTITIEGYEGEPYARVLADGAVEVNTRSPAYYLNQNFYGDVTVPASASASAPPRWTVLDRTGQFEWHDHRIHWMSPVPPPQVKDRGRRTKIFDWRVPIQVGSQPATVDGQLFWVPEEGTRTPTGAIVALAAIVALSLGLVLFIRRRRSGAPPPSGAGGGGQVPEPGKAREAW